MPKRLKNDENQLTHALVERLSDETQEPEPLTGTTGTVPVRNSDVLMRAARPNER